MKQYAKIINQETKELEVGFGTDSKFYKSLGMSEMQVEQDFDGRYYLSGFAPKQSLEQVKQNKINELKTMRDNLEQGGFEYDGKTFDSDAISIQKLAVSTTAVEGTDLKIFWTIQDNSSLDMGHKEFKACLQALARHSNSLHRKYNELKTQVNITQTTEEVEAVQWV